MLEQEIDRVMKRMVQGGTDPEIACAAVKQLVCACFPPSDTVAFERLADALFRKYPGFGADASALSKEIKVAIDSMQAKRVPDAVWLES